MEQQDAGLATTTVAGAGTARRYATATATKFELIGPGTASVTSGLEREVRLSGPVSDIEHLDVKVEADTLKVAYRGGFLRHRAPDGPLRYELAVPILEGLSLSGGLAAEATDIEGRKLDVALADGSSLALTQLKLNELDARVAGGSRLMASGSAARQKVKLSDKSTYLGVDLACEEAEIEAAGGSTASVRAAKKLKAKASGGSVIAYGGPKIDLSVQTSDGSELRRLE